MLTKRPCCVCRRWFVPDHRVGRRQRACSATACQIARRVRTQASWRRRNPDYFIAHRLQQRRVLAEEAPPSVPPLVLPPPLSQPPCRRRGACASGVEQRVPSPRSSAMEVSHVDPRESDRQVLRDIVESLSPEERHMCIWMAAGFSKQQIANGSGQSIDAVEAILMRTRQRIGDRLKTVDCDSRQ
jgi:DNA-directed RNA polymerase specialized sigma24 family protein